jgi:hypothetical protein
MASRAAATPTRRRAGRAAVGDLRLVAGNMPGIATNVASASAVKRLRAGVRTRPSAQP